jgi:hypothetical protein
MAKRQKIRSRYRQAEGKRWIEVRIKSPQQLFDARDPAPFLIRDLDDDFVEYILSSAREIPFAAPVKIVIYVGDPEGVDLNKEAVREAIRSYLSYQIELQRGALRQFARRAQFFLVMGVAFLAACLFVAQKIGNPTSFVPLSILREGVVILGWVSVWKPIELILFDWYPLYEKLRLYRKLMQADLDVRFAASPQIPA